MKQIIERSSDWLRQISWFQSKEQTSDATLPLGMTSCLCLFGLILAWHYIPWTHFFILSLFPISACFCALYSSRYYQELKKVQRAIWMYLISMMIYGSAALLIGLMLIVVAFVAMAIAGGSGPG